MYGFKQHSLKLLESYLTNWTQKCCIKSAISNPETIKCGVPQASILGPLFVLVHINHLPKCCILMSKLILQIIKRIKNSNNTSEIFLILLYFFMILFISLYLITYYKCFFVWQCLCHHYLLRRRLGGISGRLRNADNRRKRQLIIVLKMADTTKQ